MTVLHKENRNFLRTHGPAIVMFSLGALSSGMASYMMLREGVARNAQLLSERTLDIVKMETAFGVHEKEYSLFRDKVIGMSGDVDSAFRDRDEFKTVLGQIVGSLDKMNTTLTRIETGYSKDIESINRRLDKAGI